MNIAPRSLSRTRRKWLWRIVLLALPPLLIAGVFARLRTWRPRTLTVMPDRSVMWMAWMPDSQRLAVVSMPTDETPTEGNNYELSLWRAADAKRLWLRNAGVDLPCRVLRDGRIVTNGESLRIWNDKGDVLDDRRDGGDGLAYNGDLLAQGGNGRAISLWNLKKSPVAPGEPRLLGDVGFIHALAISPDGTTLASNDYTDITPKDKKDNAAYVINLWDVKSGKLKRRLPPFNQPTVALAFSPDGYSLAVRGSSMMSGGPIGSVWDVATGKVAFHFGLQSAGAMGDIAFSPDGTLLAFDDGLTVELRDARSGIVKRTLKVPQSHDFIRGFAFAPDGATLAMGSLKGAITLWRLK